MQMRKLVFGLAVLIWVSQARPAFALCAGRSAEEMLKQSDAAFVGKVIKLEYLDKDLSPLRYQIPRRVKLTFQISKAMKGAVKTPQEIYGWDDPTFAENPDWRGFLGETIIVYANHSSDILPGKQVLVTGQCLIYR